MILQQLYNDLSIIATASVLLVCGLMFLFIDVPRSPLLSNYRKARFVMAVAYLFIVIAAVSEYLFTADSSETDIHLLQTVILIIAVSQASLYTVALIALLDIKFPGWSYIFWKLFPAQLYILSVFMSYLFCPIEYFNITYYVFCGLYVIFLVCYTYIFIKYYRRFHIKMDNYFSDSQAEKVHWIVVSFFSALSVGMMALLSAIFASLYTAIIFTLVSIAFYIWFAIRFINYGFRFHVIENALEEETIPPQIEETDDDDNNETEISIEECENDTIIFSILEKRINQWVSNKGFINKGITIAILSKELMTNRCYLSTYINTRTGKTFREWINQLRIEEAKTLMRQNPNITVNDIAQKTGFTDKSHFIRQFSNLTGASPKEWKLSEKE